MNADSFFSIGTTHQVCQDYARAGIIEDKPYVIVSDGCSTAPDSDFGCRLITKSAEVNIHEPNIELFLKKTLEGVSDFSDKINLSKDSLCATLLVARVIDEKLQIIVVGDGAFVVDNVFWNIHFDSGAPYYLRYELDNKIKSDYFKKFPPLGRIEKQKIEQSEASSDAFELKNETLKDIAFVYEWDKNTVKNLTLFSDGINSFTELERTTTSKQPKPVSALAVAKELIGFKNFSGEFVQRRCKRAMKDFANRNWSHFDDLSVASIKVNE